MTGSLRHRMIRAALHKAMKPLATPSTPLAVQRALIDAATFSMRTPGGLRTETATLGGIAGRKLTPRNASATRHLLYLHGGAYISGSPRSHVSLAGQVGAAARATTWLIDYRLAPEHPYPAAEEDALAAYRALLGQGIPATHIAIAGDSAGGGLTLATLLAARDAGLPLPACVALLSPWTDLTLSGRSITAKADVEPMLVPEFLEWAADAYCGGQGEGRYTLRTHPGVSPLFADLGGLPPMMVHVGGDEILLDDATFLAHRARVAGVDARLRVFDHLWHVFQAQAGMIPEADESLRDIGVFLDEHYAT